MIVLLLLTVAIILLLAAGVLLYAQVALMREAKVSAVRSDITPEHVVDWAAFTLVAASRHGLKYAFVYALLILRKLANWLRHLLGEAEQKFTHWLEAARRRGSNHHKGSVSLFLQEISNEVKVTPATDQA